MEAGGYPANHVARWDGSQWHSLGSGAQNGVNGLRRASVFALAVWGSDVYVGGGFFIAGGEYAGGVARWDGREWRALGDDLGLMEEYDYPGVVYAMAANGPIIDVGGLFHFAGGEPSSYIATFLVDEVFRDSFEK